MSSNENRDVGSNKGSGDAAAAPSDVFSGAAPVLHAPMPRRKSRPPPPPPILMRTTTDKPGGVIVTGPDDDDGGEGADAKREIDSDEASDIVPDLPDLPPTPGKRSSLIVDRPVTPTGSDGRLSPGLPLSPMTPGRPRTPGSPSWAPFDHVGSPGRAAGLEVPLYNLPPSPNAEPSQRQYGHHGFHSRNLSAHFPQPGAPPRAPSPTLIHTAGDSVIPGADRSAFGAGADYQSPTLGPGGAGASPVRAGKRRGHHHRHSLSHNFFSFLDPTQTQQHAPAASTAEGSGAAPPDMSTAPNDRPQPVPMDFTSSPLSPLPTGKRDTHTQAIAAFTVLDAVLGVALWVEGQISGWRCLTAAGYLVVFDAMGLGVSLLALSDRLGWRSLRRPYGSSRVTSLLCFAQSVFLVFAAVYIAKEAMEQVILGAGAHDHAAASGHGHSHHEHGAGDERSFPQLFLLCAALATLFSGAALGNHSRLVDATGSLFLPPWYLGVPAVAAYPFLANPYTLSITGTCAALLIASFVVPTASLHRLDSIASLVLTLLTGSLAYAPTAAYAHVLLQTAPPASTLQMKALRRALRDVTEDRRVLGLGTMRCWAINAGKVGAAQPSAVPGERNASTSITSRHSSFNLSSAPNSPLLGATESPLALAAPDTHVPLVVTLQVHVHPESTDRDVLDITRLAWSRISNAVGRGYDGGEVTVEVRRGWE